MAQNFTDDCFDASHVGQTDLGNIENNFACLKSSFSGTSAPSNPVAGMLWYDTTNNLLKLRNAANNAWLEIYDFGNDRVPSGKVKTASLQDGALSADTTGRAKMADNYITSAKVNDVDGSKIVDASIATAKHQNNAVTPSKLAPGASTLVSWHSVSSVDGTPQMTIDSNATAPPAYTNLQNLNTDGSTYKKVFGYYVYIPTGAKYLVLGMRGYASKTLYLRMNVNGTTGGTASVRGTSITNGNSGSALDVSALAGAWRYLYIEAVLGGSSIARLQSLVVQWYGA